MNQKIQPEPVESEDKLKERSSRHQQVRFLINKINQFLINFILVYKIKLDDNELSDTHGDIVVAHEGQGKLEATLDAGNHNDGHDDDSSDALTNAVTLLAGSAIMLIQMKPVYHSRFL